MSNFIIVKDMSAGNSSVGEQWQECKIFDGNATLNEVMVWAVEYTGIVNKKHVQILIPDNATPPSINTKRLCFE